MHSNVEVTLTGRTGSSPTALSEPAVELVEVARRFGPVQALAGVSLAIRRGEFFSLLGPSGCGKTTLLRIIAGLDLPDTGALRIGGREAGDLPAHRRPVNTVFQSYALFPHLTVWDNIAFGLRMKRIPKAEIERRVAQIMDTVQITDLAKRKPDQLSGGQKQRAALARATVNEPEVLLLDEPLGALDLKLRKQLQVELHTLQKRLGMTFIYVTHDQDEALVMSDRLAVMNAGKIEQLGAAVEVYERPKTRFVAEFLGSCNLLAGEVAECAGRELGVRTGLGQLRVERNADTRPLRAGEACTLAIRPEKVRLLESRQAPAANGVTARVTDLVYTGSETQYLFATPAGSLRVWVLNSTNGRKGIQVGEEAALELPSAALVVLDD